MNREEILVAIDGAMEAATSVLEECTSQEALRHRALQAVKELVELSDARAESDLGKVLLNGRRITAYIILLSFISHFPEVEKIIAESESVKKQVLSSFANAKTQTSRSSD